MADIDNAFAETTKLLFGKPLSPISKYGDWLLERLGKGESVKSVFGNGQAYLPDYAFFSKIPKNKIGSFADLDAAGGKKVNAEDVSENRTLAGIIQKIKPVSYFVPDFVEGNNLNVTNTTVYLDCVNVHNSFDIFRNRNTAYCLSTIDSESLFGCYRVLDSKFCIKCYNVSNLSGCFEMDVARNCSGAMFCHNVENVHDSMFCFNVKNKRHAIGNVEVGREKYLRMREVVVREIVESLEKSGRFELDIYNALG